MSICTNFSFKVFSNQYIIFGNKINIPKRKRVLFLFDIDGVACRSLSGYTEMNMTFEDYYNFKKDSECNIQFIKTIQLLKENNMNIMFLTGRKPNIKNITYNMFERAGFSFIKNEDLILFHPKNIGWNEYINVKYNKILMLLGNQPRQILDHIVPFDIIYYFEDNIPLIDFLKEKQFNEYFKSINLKSQLKIFYVNFNDKF